jgi:O-antigen/teichoic acid export membrane protein
VDILLLGRFVGLQAVEIYSVIVMIANTLKSVRQSFDGIMLSVFSRGGRKLTAEGGQKFNHVTWIVLSAQIPVFFAALFFGRELLGLISPAYATGHYTLLISLGSLLLIAPFGFSTQLLMGLGKTWAIPMAQALFFASTFGFNTLLIPLYGMEGAAVATGLSYFLSALFCMAVLRWRLKTWIFQRPYFASTAIEAAIFAAPALVFLLWRPPLAGSLALFLGAGITYWMYFRRAWRGFLKRETEMRT